MIFSSYQIRGKGRGKPFGFPTINLEIPENFKLKDGVYAVIVNINGKFFTGAMHYGPIPVFHEVQKSLEIFLLDVNDSNIPQTYRVKIEVEVRQYIREVRNFVNPDELGKQIQKDIIQIRQLV